MKETVNVLNRRNARAVAKEIHNIPRKLSHRDEQLQRAECDGPFLVRDSTTITLDEITQAAQGKAKRSLISEYASGLLNLLRESTMQLFRRLVREVVAESAANVFDFDVRLGFVKSGYMQGGNIPTLNDVDFDNGFIREAGKISKTLKRVFATDCFGSSGEKRNSFVLVAGDG